APGGHIAAKGGRRGVEGETGQAGPGHQGGAGGGHRRRRLDPARLPGGRRLARLFPAQLQGLWPRGPALPYARLPRRDPAQGPGRALDLLLRRVPEMIRRLIVSVAALVLLAPAMAWATPPVWVRHGRGATITLFGSVHVLPHDLDWEPGALKTALAGADELWFEIPIDPADLLDATQEALKKGMLPSGQNLSSLLSKDGKARLKRQEQ